MSHINITFTNAGVNDVMSILKFEKTEKTTTIGAVSGSRVLYPNFLLAIFVIG